MEITWRLMILMLNLLLLILVPFPPLGVDFTVDSVVVLEFVVAVGALAFGWLVWILVISCIYFACPVISLKNASSR
jgi:hypothetical protein